MVAEDEGGLAVADEPVLPPPADAALTLTVLRPLEWSADLAEDMIDLDNARDAILGESR